jgi:hypothetical protein
VNAPVVTTQVGTSPALSGTTTASVIAGGVPLKGLKGLRARLSAMAQGWATVFPSDVTLPSADGGYSAAAVVSQLSSWLSMYAAVDSTETAWRAAVAGLAAAEPSLRAELLQLKTAVLVYFGNTSPQLTQFGIAPKKARAKLSGAKLAVRAARATETRQIRGTRGAKQKAALGKSSGPLVSQVVPAAATASVTEAVPASTAVAAPVASPPAVTAASAVAPAPAGSTSSAT